MIKEKTYLVLIKNLILKAYVGIYPKEKIRKQKVRFNISISALDNIKTKVAVPVFPAASVAVHVTGVVPM